MRTIKSSVPCINKIISAVASRDSSALSFLEKTTPLDIIIFSPETNDLESAAKIFACNKRNDLLIFLALNSKTPYQILSQAIAYYIGNSNFLDISNLIYEINTKTKFQIFEILNITPNYFIKNENTQSYDFFESMILVLCCLSSEEKLKLVTKSFVKKSLLYGFQTLTNSNISPEYQHKFFVLSLLDSYALIDHNLIPFALDALRKDNLRASFTENIEKWHWEWLIDNNFNFGAITSFLSNNLLDRISQYQYAFAHFHKTSNLNAFTFTLSYIDSHEDYQAGLIKSALFSPEDDISSIRPKSLDQLPFRRTQTPHNICF